MPPNALPWSIAEIRANPVAAIDLVRSHHRFLSTNGYFQNSEPSSEQNESSRAAMTDSQSVSQFLLVIDWLEAVEDWSGHSSTVDTRGSSSYDWKHEAERWNRIRLQRNQDVNCDISNGMLISACLALGVAVKPIPDSPNANLAICAWSATKVGNG